MPELAKFNRYSKVLNGSSSHITIMAEFEDGMRMVVCNVYNVTDELDPVPVFEYEKDCMLMELEMSKSEKQYYYSWVPDTNDTIENHLKDGWEYVMDKNYDAIEYSWDMQYPTRRFLLEKKNPNYKAWV